MIGSLNLSQTQWARNVVQVSAAVSGEERCVTRQITAAWETTTGPAQYDLLPFLLQCHLEFHRRLSLPNGGPFQIGLLLAFHVTVPTQTLHQCGASLGKLCGKTGHARACHLATLPLTVHGDALNE